MKLLFEVCLLIEVQRIHKTCPFHRLVLTILPKLPLLEADVETLAQGGTGLEYAYPTTKKHEQDPVVEPSTEDYSEVSVEDDPALAPAKDAPPLKDSKIAQLVVDGEDTCYGLIGDGCTRGEQLIVVSAGQVLSRIGCASPQVLILYSLA
ncbi:hypothetical protein R1flu_005107 [Riccia fluitans]|uniref:Uncharacterized protein n=1 Tax=Riccia fluitans TaxID=41844 RepID=A0ABD1YSI6_9MARC